VLIDNSPMHAIALDPRNIRDLSPLLLDESGQLKVVPAAVYEQTTVEERALFGVQRGLYSFPTQELVDFLQDHIQGRSAIEVGAGHGGLATALGIPATDNRQQEEPAIRAYYQLTKQPPVPYGKHVEKLTAEKAVAKYQPKVVVACWVTHRYDPRRHAAGGNQDGVVEEAIIANCDSYVFIGNEKVHQHKAIWALPHKKLTPPWLYSRAFNGSANFIAIWERASLVKPPAVTP
jgi:hypothetical protein